jgi:hypothetical protein
MPAAVEARLEAVDSVGALGTGAHPVTPAAIVDAADPAPVTAVARRALSGGCAASTAQLVMDLRAAIELGDVNRLAESYHWTGLDHARAQRIMRRLEALATQPLRAVDTHTGTAAAMLYADASGRAPPQATVRRMRLRFEGSGASLVEFDVEPYNGCYFVRF